MAEKRPERVAAARRLASRIRAEGPVTVADFMQEAVAGYYATQPPFGVAGDFTTAPEISQMFGEMTGAFLLDAWMRAGRPSPVSLIELGPGQGTLMADMLRVMRPYAAFCRAVSVHLVENSQRLRAAQRAKLAGVENVFWHDRLQDVPPGGFTLIVANEFFDALPVHQFVHGGQGTWRARRVGFDPAADKFFFDGERGDEKVFELSLATLSVMEEICRRLRSGTGGTALLVDYGYDVLAFGDTLQALSRHRFADALDNPGGQDLTAHVDFGLLAFEARRNGLRVQGPVGQGEFLLSLGIAQRAEMLAQHATPVQRQEIMTALRRLTAPSEMGTLFKALAVSGGFE